MGLITRLLNTQLQSVIACVSRSFALSSFSSVLCEKMQMREKSAQLWLFIPLLTISFYMHAFYMSRQDGFTIYIAFIYLLINLIFRTYVV